MSKRQREQQQRKEKETSIALQKDSKSQRKKQSHPNELSESSRRRDVRRSERPEKEGRFVELVDDQNPGPEASPRSKKGGSKRDTWSGSTARGAFEKIRYVKVIEEVRRNDSIEYFLPTGVRSAFWAPEGVMIVTVPQNGEISENGKNGRRKGVGSAISRRRANRGSINI